jgi:putative phosphoribosyl transferase
MSRRPVHDRRRETEMQVEELRDSQLRIPAGMAAMAAELRVPAGAVALVVLAYAGGGLSPAQFALQEQLGGADTAVLTLNLLTPDEAAADRRTGHVRYDAALLASRLVAAVDWLSREAATSPLKLGLHAGGTAASAALIAGVRRAHLVGAVVCSDGHFEGIPPVLSRLSAPTLFLASAGERSLHGTSMAVARQLTASPAVRVPEPAPVSAHASAAVDWFSAWLPQPALTFPPGWVAA